MQQQQQQQPQQQQQRRPFTGAQPAPAPASNMPKVQDALGYLERVKNRFAQQPIVYNQFLDIMKDFKSQNIDTEGVIKRVKSLFKGNRSLILGFNQFLPPGYKIELEPSPPEKRPTIEFKQAMEYVAKIKNRFRDEPYIYAEFLDILHDYQAKRTIDEVYLRVQKLFKGQPDLLDEFKYFLPESAVTPKTLAAKGPQGKTAAAAGKAATPTSKTGPGAKPAAKTAPGVAKQSYDASGRPYPAKPGPKPAVPASKTDARSVQRDSRGNLIAPPKEGGSSSIKHKPGTVGAAAAANAVPSSSGHRKHGEHREHRHHHGSSSHAARVSYPPGSEKELSLLERMKSLSTKAQWIQFLKALNLFANDLVNRGELIRMVEDVYGERASGIGGAGVLSGLSSAGDIVERFKQTIGYDEQEEKAVASLNQTNYYAFVSSVDFNICHQVTPSYRELPPQILVPHSTGRTALGDEVLNDTCISIPTGSEDFSFKATRKNIYEENLFKCEDERFELDMLIENNSAAIRVLEPLSDQVAALGSSEQALKRVRLPDTIDILHIRAIARVYGEQGYEMVELLNKAPTLAVPIILARLRQKDVEWRKIRNEMKATWRKVNEQNYQRSLDHRSFYFKQEDKKRRSPKALVVELREVQHAVFGSGQPDAKALPPPASSTRAQVELKEGGEAVKKALPSPTQEDLTGEESLMLRAIRQGQPPNPLYSYCMRFKYGDSDIHHQMFDILSKVASSTLTDINHLKAMLFLQSFAAHFFGVPVTDAQQRKIDELAEKIEADEERRRAGIINDEDTAPQGDAAAASSNAAAAAGGDAGKELADDASDDEGDKYPAAGMSTSVWGKEEEKKQPAPGAKGKKKSKAKSKSTKKKQLGKPHPSLAAASAAAAAAVAAKDEDDDDAMMDDDEEDNKRSGGRYSKHKDDADGEDGHDMSNARQRATAAANSAAAQLATVKGVLSKLRTASAGGAGAAGLPPVQLHLDSPWLLEEQAKESAGSAAAAAAASGGNASSVPSSSSRVPPLRKHGRPSRLFLGSHAYYVFFRLHQFLYERLHTAKTLAHKARRNSSKKKLPATAEERHARFCVLLDQLLQGELETARFEDELRNLLGASSYVLFTIDKLIAQLLKQTVLLLSSDNSLKVLSLYQYEYRRVRTAVALAKKNNLANAPTEQMAALARQYLSNIANLLGDDSACAVEYFEDTSELAIGLVEHLDESNKHVAGEEWNQFVSEYLSDMPAVSVRQPFRRRTVRLAARAFLRLMTASASAKEKARVSKDSAESTADALAFATKQTFQKHGLSSKLDLRSFKLHFLEHTSDVLLRSRKEQTARNNSARASQEARSKRMLGRFHSWLKRRQSDLAPIPDDSSAGALLNSLGFDGGDGGYGGDEEGVGESGGIGADGADGDGGAAGDSNVAEALMAAGLEAAADLEEQEADAMDEGQDQQEADDEDMQQHSV